MLGAIAGPESLSDLRDLALCTDEDLRVSGAAVDGLMRLKTPLRLNDLDRLVERQIRERPSDFRVFRLVRSPEERAIARRHLERAGSAYRCSILSALGSHGHTWTKNLCDWIYPAWLKSDRVDTPGLSDSVIAATASRFAESRRMLLNHWRATGADLENVPYELRRSRELATWAMQDPSRVREAARAMVLPLDELLGVLGRERLLARMKEDIRAASREADSEEGDEAWTKIRRSVRWWGIAAVVSEWREASDLVLRLAESTEIASEVRKELLCELIQLNRARIVRWAIARSSSGTDDDVVAAIVSRLCFFPEDEEDERALYRRMAQSDGTKWVVRNALVALEALGADDEWWQRRLLEVSERAERVSRVWALSKLAARGHVASSRSLSREAAESPDSGDRGLCFLSKSWCSGYDRSYFPPPASRLGWEIADARAAIDPILQAALDPGSFWLGGLLDSTLGALVDLVTAAENG